MIDPRVDQPTLRVRPGPNDSNLRGDVFGGWLMSQIDIAASAEAGKAAGCMTVTRAVKDLTFIKPIFTYDLVSFYTEVEKIGNTSVTVRVEVFAQRTNSLNLHEKEMVKVSDAVLVFVAVETIGQKRIIEKK